MNFKQEVDNVLPSTKENIIEILFLFTKVRFQRLRIHANLSIVYNVDTPRPLAANILSSSVDV